MKNYEGSFIAIGQNVWGHADNIYDAIKNAYSQGNSKNNRFKLFLVSNDWQVSEINGGVSATFVHSLGYFNNGGQSLKGSIK